MVSQATSIHNFLAKRNYAEPSIWAYWSYNGGSISIGYIGQKKKIEKEQVQKVGEIL